MQQHTADIVVIGGGLGGVAAALAALKSGMRVVVTEETDWIGGQMTAQAVPPDEHRWIEQFGCTATYREFRERVRDYYRTNYPLTEDARNNKLLNPGNGWVSRLAHEPKVALRVLEDMLAPYLNSKRLEILYYTVAIDADVVGNHIESVTVENFHSGDRLVLKGDYILDATETGSLLELVQAEFVAGAEARSETGEPHALEVADPLDMQSITHVAALEYVEGGHFVIDKPEQYEFWKSYIPSYSKYPILDWHAMDAEGLATKEFTLFPNDQGIMSFWDYRRVLDPTHLAVPLYDGDITLLNWPQNDYFLGPIIGVTPEERDKHLEAARQLTLSLIYWLQTEAPRLDGGVGYPGIRLHSDALGTKDGLAKSVYIRESRRIKALYTITEHDVSMDLRGDDGIKRYEDSVGIGSYYLDLHPTTVTQRGFYVPNYPYEIPLGALLPVRMTNLLPACKNIGTTQVSNGCYRLHPTEWNIGESAGYLAAYAVLNKVTPHEVRERKEHLDEYLQLLSKQGIERHWPEWLNDELVANRK